MDVRKRWKTSLEWAEHAHFLWWLAGWLVTGIIAPVWAILQGNSWQQLLFLGALVLVCAMGLAFISSLLWWKFVGRKREQRASLAALATIAAAPAADDPEEVLPLQVAARLAYEAVEGTVLGMRASRIANAPDGPLCFMAEKLYEAEMPVYGKRFPSSKVMGLGTDILFSQKFKQDAAVVEDEGNRVTYTDLTAKRGEMTTAIEVLKGAYKDR